MNFYAVETPLLMNHSFHNFKCEKMFNLTYLLWGFISPWGPKGPFPPYPRPSLPQIKEKKYRNLIGRKKMILNDIHSFKFLLCRVVAMLGDKEETFCLPVTNFKEGQMLKIGGWGGVASFTDVGPSDKLSAKFIITSFKYY